MDKTVLAARLEPEFYIKLGRIFEVLEREGLLDGLEELIRLSGESPDTFSKIIGLFPVQRGSASRASSPLPPATRPSTIAGDKSVTIPLDARDLIRVDVKAFKTALTECIHKKFGTLAKCATASGNVSLSTLSRMLRSDSMPQKKMLDRLARVLSVDALLVERTQKLDSFLRESEKSSPREWNL